MHKKIMDFIKENLKSIIIAVVLYIIFIIPVNYYIITGGGIMPVGNRIVVISSNKVKGSFNLAYVTEARGNVATYLLSYVMPNWKRVKVSNYTYDDSENAKDINFRSNIDLLNVSSYAIKNAYKESSNNYILLNTDIYVYYVSPDKNIKFKVGDKVLKVNNQNINDVEEYKSIINNYHEGDRVKVVVERNNREKELDVSIYKEKNTLLTGIYIKEVNTYKTYPKVKIKFKKSESGPSGGLIEALDIYNKLTKKDITKGMKIAGTGEIDNEGNVLSIGEVKYKLLGAAKSRADIFIVPNGDNYKTCLKVKKKNKLKIKIIGVSTFREAIEKLNSI